VELEVDHIVPRSRGGADIDENLITACEDCNRSKHATPLSGVEERLHVIHRKLILTLGEHGAGKRVIGRMRHANEMGVSIERIEWAADTQIRMVKEGYPEETGLPIKEFWDGFWSWLSVLEWQARTEMNIFDLVKDKSEKTKE
jgi:hypothetical protein